LLNKSIYTNGFAESILLKTNPKLQIPHFSTVSRRIGNIQVDLHKIKHSKGEKLIISIDGSGLKVYGESEWKVRQHGVGKRRVCKKIHLAVTETGEIEAVEVTNNNTHDKVLATKLLKQIENVSKVIFDGAYDHADIYLYCKEEKLEMIVPPRVDAVPWAADHPRTKAVEQIKRTSLDVWKNLSGYHARSVVENAFYRFKTVFGQHLSFRKDANQKIEVSLKCSILNQFYQLGRCASYVFNPVVI
jgi:transposase